jgi:hypothetical protein
MKITIGIINKSICPIISLSRSGAYVYCIRSISIIRGTIANRHRSIEIIGIIKNGAVCYNMAIAVNP